jgi:hypothetical protein
VDAAIGTDEQGELRMFAAAVRFRNIQNMLRIEEERVHLMNLSAGFGRV